MNIDNVKIASGLEPQAAINFNSQGSYANHKNQ